MLKTRKKSKKGTPLIDALIEAGQDFEWYPTDDQMIGVVARHIKQKYSHGPCSILDIGAGDGRVLKGLVESFKKQDEQSATPDLYAIEKAPIHIENMPADIVIVGTDFRCQTLIDKDVEVIFCNPPYSEYEDWAVKIIKEALCNDAYLILPKRWFDSLPIRAALASRESKAQILWSGDFLNAERKARASVDVLYVSLCDRRDRYDTHPDKKDPFEVWFHETFPEVEVLDTLKDESAGDKQIGNDLLTGYNLVDRLVELYQADMGKMHASYRALCQIDPALLKTVGVEAKQVKAGLRAKIKGLKNLYWQELFDHLDKVTARLTTGSRKSIVEKMASAVHVDFTVDNAYAVVLWVLKNANLYIDTQLTDLFRKLSDPECIRNYRSNQKAWEKDRWRFRNNKSHSHYMLDYRILTHQYCAIYHDTDGYGIGRYECPNGLHRDCHDLLKDIGTVANNLGFTCAVHPSGFEWVSGSPCEFRLYNGEVLMRVKAFKNGNFHFQFHQGFIKALNIEAGRLLGWIRSPQEASEEMDIDFETARKHFRSNKVFVASEYKLLTA